MTVHYQVLWRELEEVSKIFTGLDSYEYSDMNRIEMACRNAYSQFVNSGYVIENIEPCVTNRNAASIIRVSDFQKIERNFRKLDINRKFEYKTWYEGRIFDYTDANRYEKAAELLKSQVDSIQSGWNYCGESICS